MIVLRLFARLKSICNVGLLYGLVLQDNEIVNDAQIDTTINVDKVTSEISLV